MQVWFCIWLEQSKNYISTEGNSSLPPVPDKILIPLIALDRACAGWCNQTNQYEFG